MAAELRLMEIADAAGQVVAPEWLRSAERVHRQLRPDLPADYAARMAQIFADGARMVVAAHGETVVGLALWRVVENTYEGRRFYIDDLTTDQPLRSQGIGNTVMAWLTARARSLDCDVMALDSGVQRPRAHAFYFREGFSIPSFCFRKRLK
jgi:GNAT superfamily N-acetyltransferase